MMFRRVRERSTGRERLFVITVYAGSLPLGARGALNPELAPAPTIGLLDSEGPLVTSIFERVDSAVRAAAEPHGLFLVK